MNEQDTKRNNTPEQEAAAEPRTIPARKNPRLVVGGLDYFEMLLEQEEP